MEELFLKIKQLTKEEGSNILELQRKLGFGCRSIYNWKKKKSPLLENVYKVAEYYQVSLDYLTGRTSNREIYFSKSEKRQKLIEKIISSELDDNKLDCIMTFIDNLDYTEREV